MTDRRRTLRNRYGYGLGTLGRDSAYTLVNMFLLFYLSDILRVSTPAFAGVTVVLVIARLFDAVNDPFMGVIVDNTRSRHGKFAPWILSGVLLSAAFTILLFTPGQLGDAAFVAVFAVVYLGWEVSYTANDIAYWSMLPALTGDQRERERIGAFARICASVGAFSMVVAVVPVSTWIGELIGDVRWSYFWVACAAAALMVVFQLTMLALVRERREPVAAPPTRLRDMLTVIFGNDQLLAVTAALALFMIAFSTTTSFGIYYFRYVYGDEALYAVFALVLGVSQITALALYPLIARLWNRRRLFTVAMVLVVAGYALFFAAGPGEIAVIVVSGVAIFAAQAVLQMLMLMFIADTVEYGEHKLGRRNDAVTLSLQPFIYKLGSAAAAGIVGWTVLASGMKDAVDAQGMTDAGVLLVKTMMMLVPMLLVVGSYLVWRRFYRLDEVRYARILDELTARKASATDAAEPADA